MRLALKNIASVINGRGIGKTRLKKMGKLQGLRPYLTGIPLAKGTFPNTKERSITLIIKVYMGNWFISKVAYEKMLENGMQKRVVEPYLVDALSYTEAEARTIEELRPYITGEFTIADITRKKIAELFFNDNGDRFYEIKIYFITLDEKSGMEKKTAAIYIVQASDLKEAISCFEDNMKGTLADYTLARVSETFIMDIFPFDAESVPKSETNN